MKLGPEFRVFCGAFAAMLLTASSGGQVFVVGEKTAMADVSTDFKPTRVELPRAPLTERGRRELVRNLDAEQGFAHRVLPVSDAVTLQANGQLTPAGDAYRELVYKKGESVAPGDRVLITAITFKGDRIVFDLNGGPYLKHRFLRHINLNGVDVVQDNGEVATGSRVTLIFEGGIPEIGAPEVKALLDPVIDFGVKTSEQAYADTLPSFLKDAIAQHDVLVGMNRRMVLAAAGAPESKVRERIPGSDTRHYEEWIYGHVPQTVRFVRLEGDRVTEVRIAALGKAIDVHTRNEIGDYLDPLPDREIALGISGLTAGDTEHAAGAGPPTLRKPGEAAPADGPGRVKDPVSTRVERIPAPPGQDDTGNEAPGVAITPAGRGTTPGSPLPQQIM
jgi:hypothetical protein